MNRLFYILTAIAIVLLFVSFIIPPTGVIDSSVLAAVGELFGFSALGVLLHAINKGMDAKVTHKDTTIEINNDEYEK